MVWLVANIPDSLRLIGRFRDREGSDVLRYRIIELEHDRVAGAPWYGNGPGTSYVRVGADELLLPQQLPRDAQRGRLARAGSADR